MSRKPIADNSGPIIIVGAHPDAEVFDRPLAYRLQAAPAWSTAPTVLTDVWTLSHDEYRERPFVSIGGPSVNAVTAAFADRLPSIWSVDERHMVQMDAQGPVPAALCWGVNPEQTACAANAFLERYLPLLIEALAARA